jgi:transcriptional regulator with XRE-family HTH domain
MESKTEGAEIHGLEDLTPGELVRQARIRHELSQKQLATRAGTTQSAIARIERDRNSPSIKTLTALFQAMGEDFVFGARQREWGVDLTLNRRNLEHSPTERLERSHGFSGLAGHLRGRVRVGRRLRRACRSTRTSDLRFSWRNCWEPWTGIQSISS